MAILRHLKQRLLLTGLLFGVVAGSPKAADAEERTSSAGQDLITAQGYGELRVRPDSLRTSVGVEVRASTLEKARADVGTRLARLIKALTALRIPGAVLQTQTLEFYPIYSEENNNKPRKIIAYSATHRLSVTVLGATPTDLGDYTSRIIDTAIQSGANVIGDVDFFLRDTSVAQGRALEAAVLNAGQNARAMAEAGRVRITRLHSLDESSEGGFTPLRFTAAAKLSAAVPTPIETGEIVVTSNVTARFSFSK
jgi:uncharacterized protein YggE